MSALSYKKKATLRKAPSEADGEQGKWRKAFKWLAIITFVLIAIFVSVFLYVWFNRYALVESYAQRLFREQGIKAELLIKQFSGEEAVIENVKLTYKSEAQPFFSAKRIEADYILEDALKGRMKKVRLVEPTARLTLNEKFQIIDGWMPPKDKGGGGGISIPEDGLFIEEASFDLRTPFGEPAIGMTANIRDTEQFDATLILSPS